jgi:hypothetical protein
MMATLRCMTCHKDFSTDSPLIHTRLPLIEDTCICHECVDVAQKRSPPKPRDKH